MLTSVQLRRVEKNKFTLWSYRKAISERKVGLRSSCISVSIRYNKITTFVSGFELAKEIWSKDEQARICFLSAFEIYQSEAQKVFRNFKTHSFIKPIKVSALAKHLELHVIPAKPFGTTKNRLSENYLQEEKTRNGWSFW